MEQTLEKVYSIDEKNTTILRKLYSEFKQLEPPEDDILHDRVKVHWASGSDGPGFKSDNTGMIEIRCRFYGYNIVGLKGLISSKLDNLIQYHEDAFRRDEQISGEMTEREVEAFEDYVGEIYDTTNLVINFIFRENGRVDCNIGLAEFLNNYVYYIKGSSNLMKFGEDEIFSWAKGIVDEVDFNRIVFYQEIPESWKQLEVVEGDISL